MAVTILSFGTLHKKHGGSLATGLSFVMWQLAYYLNKKDDVKVLFAVTDFFVEKRIIEDVEVLGWTKFGVIKYALKNVLSTIKFFLVSFYLLLFYRLKFIRSFVYLIIIDKAIRSNKHDIMHVHGTNYIYFHFINKKRRKPIVLTIHGINGFDPNVVSYNNQRKIEKLISAQTFRNIVFVSSELKTQWIKKYGELKSECSVIFNSFDSSSFYYDDGIAKKHRKIIISTVGRVYPLKGQERTILALSQREEFNNFEYWVIGDGDSKYIEKLHQLANTIGVNVVFWGLLDSIEVAKKLRESDYMILPSTSEGFGIAFLESIACGTKVIIPAALPLCKEKSIINSENALLLQGNDIESISKCLNKIIIKPKYSKLEVSKTVFSLSWENIAKEYLQLIIDTF